MELTGIEVIELSSFLELVARFVLNLFVVLILVRYIYFQQPSERIIFLLIF
jgi:hypothetical protein